jgi:putative peptide zinc metalloprotease protein
VYADDRCEVRISGPRAVVFDRSERTYYRAPVDALPPSIRIAARPQRSSVPSWAAWSFVGLLPVLLVLNMALMPTSTRATHVADGIAAAVYLIVSIIVHEGSHVVALHRFGRSVDRVGFKLNHRVFPAFYVRMNQSLLLSRQEQVTVHAAGALVNLAGNAIVIVLNASTVRSSAVDFAAIVVFIAVSWNAVPVLDSDGYRILLALTRTDAARPLRANPPWLILVKAAGVGFIVVVVFRTALNITRSLLA